MSGYPAETFRIDGDPTAIRASALGWAEFSEQAGAAASQIRGLDTSLFIGPEADQYRDGLSGKLPPHLQATSEAYGGVASALNVFAASLDDVLERMNPLGIRAPGLWGDLTAAERAVETAKSTDLVHQQRRALEQAQLVPGEALPVDYYQPATGTAAAALTVAQHAWNQALTTAQGLKADLAAAIDVCVKAINDQAHTRFTPNPSGWSGFVAGVKGFVKDHVAALPKLSSVLKTVSMVAGFLALVPGLDIIAAPIALAAGGAALAIDAATMWATGTWDPKTLALDAVAVIPGGKLMEGAAAVGRITGRGATALLDAVTEGSQVGHAATAVADGSQITRATAAMADGSGAVRTADATEMLPLFRKAVPIESTSGPAVAMSNQAVRDVASRAGVGLDDVTVTIDHDPDLLGRQLYGHTPDDANITLYSDAFTNEETLAMTLGHERNHIYQLRTFGPARDTVTGQLYERGSYAVEDSYRDYLSIGGGMADQFKMHVEERIMAHDSSDAILAGPVLAGACSTGETVYLRSATGEYPAVCRGVELINWGRSRGHWTSLRVSNPDEVDLTEVTEVQTHAHSSLDTGRADGLRNQ